MLQRQAKTRAKLEKAVEAYVNLRGADGDYATTVRTTDRQGRPVVVFVTLNIVSEETT